MTNKRTEKILQALTAAFPQANIEIIDNSHLHYGHQGAKSGKGHFKLLITAPELQGKTRLQQHRLINNTLKVLFETDIHALEIEITKA